MKNFLSRPVAGTQPGDTVTFTDEAPMPFESSWVEYVAQLGQITLGANGLCVARRRDLPGGDIEVDVRIILGTGGGLGNFPTVSLPCVVEPLAHPYAEMGFASFYSKAADWMYPGRVCADNLSRDRVRFYSTAGGSYLNLTPASPFAWGTPGDTLHARFTVTPA